MSEGNRTPVPRSRQSRVLAARRRPPYGNEFYMNTRSGWRDLNPRERAPKARARPGCATPCFLSYDFTMTFTTKLATVGMRGFDTSERCTAAQIATVAAMKKFDFGTRYVANSFQDSSVGITLSELEEWTAAGIAMDLVQFARTSGWSATTGAADGAAAAKNALALGYPKTACLWLDLEGNIGSATNAIAYVNNWYVAAASNGMSSSALGLYVGPGVPLTPEQLYDLDVTRYWAAGAIIPDVTTRGFQKRQLYPGNITIAPGIVIDYDFIEEDWLGSLPTLCVSA